MFTHREHIMIRLGVNIDHVATLRQARRDEGTRPGRCRGIGPIGARMGSLFIFAKIGGISRIATYISSAKWSLTV